MSDEEILHVPIDFIRINPFQPRRHFGQEELEELAESIQSIGIIHPPVVRRLEGGRYYELISGERRYRASKIAGLKTIPVVVRDTSAQVSAQAALVENVQRVDLNPIEIAQALQGLRRSGLTQDQLAKQVGKKRSTIANYLRLLELPDSIKELVKKHAISMGHAKVVLSVPSKVEQVKICEQIIDNKLSVRDVEKMISGDAEAKPQVNRIQTQTKDVHLMDLQEKIQEKLGTRVSLSGTEKKGRLSIDFHGLEDLDRILDLIGVH